MRPPDDDAQKTPLRKGGPPKRGSSLVSANPNPNPNPNPIPNPSPKPNANPNADLVTQP